MTKNSTPTGVIIVLRIGELFNQGTIWTVLDFPTRFAKGFDTLFGIYFVKPFCKNAGLLFILLHDAESPYLIYDLLVGLTVRISCQSMPRPGHPTATDRP